MFLSKIVVLLKLFTDFIVIFARPGKTFTFFVKLPFLSKDAGSEFTKTAELESVLPTTVTVCDEITAFSCGEKTSSEGLKIAALYWKIIYATSTTAIRI